LSTPKYRALVLARKTKICDPLDLRSAEFGGAQHRARAPVGCQRRPRRADREDRERRARSLEQLPWILRESDDAGLFDNSGASPFGSKTKGKISLESGALPEMKAPQGVR